MMVFGDPANEELQLNEETVWGGGPHNNNQPRALKYLAEVRKLIFEGKNVEAQKIIDEEFKTPQNGMPYQIVGSLMLSFSLFESRIKEPVRKSQSESYLLLPKSVRPGKTGSWHFASCKRTNTSSREEFS